MLRDKVKPLYVLLSNTNSSRLMDGIKCHEQAS